MVKPVMDRVFIRLNDKPAATKGGIIYTDNHDTERTIGTVVSIGPDVNCVQKGDKVLFHVFDELPSYSPDVVVVRQSSILGVFEND